MIINYITSRIQFFNQLYGKQKQQIIVLTVLGFLNGMIGSLGVGVLVPLFSFFINQEHAGQDTISRFIFSFFNYIHLAPTVWTILILMGALFILKGFAGIMFGYISMQFSLNYEVNTRKDLYFRTLKSDWSYLSRQKIGYLENTLMHDVSYAKNFLKHTSKMILHSTSLLTYLVVAFNISFFITSLTLGFGMILLVILFPFYKKTRKYAKRSSDLKRIIANQINENVIGIKTVKVSHVEDKIHVFISDIFRKFKQIGKRVYFVQNVPEDSLETISVIFIISVFAVSYARPDFNFATFIVVMYLIQKVFTYVVQTHNLIHEVNGSIPYLQRIVALDYELSHNAERNEGKIPFSFNHALEFTNVGFFYDGGKPILDGISFSVAKGQMLGIVGPSGAGKTTLVDLILRLFHPQKGQIFLDGTKVRDIELGSWRKNIGYVSQDMFLKNDTIANNISFYDMDISREQMIEAARLAHCYDFICELPNGFDTVVGERGLRLSGGERQRIVLARVFVRKPSILILDEATSSLDNESELAIRKAITHIKGELTIIVIGHRLTTVMDSDLLLVLDNGAIIERGVPNVLLEDTGSHFHRMYDAALIQ